MTKTLSLVVVTFNSSSVLERCLTSFRRECESRGWSAHVIVVDHSEEEVEQERVASCGSDVLLKAPNRGYAAGLNLGLQAARGEMTVLANPDLHFEAGSLAALVDAVDEGWDLVGPALTVGGVLVPVAEDQTFAAEWRRRAARQRTATRNRYLVAEAARGSRLWDSETPLEVSTLSGCCILGRTETIRHVGPWDEAFFLYFEETDWLRRARALGLRIAQVPQARVEHRWGHSAHPAAQSNHFEASRLRFYRRYYGRIGLWLLGRGEPRPPCPSQITGAEHSLDDPTCRWFVSASPWGFPAGRFDGRGRLGEAHRRFVAASPAESRFVVWAMQGKRKILGPHIVDD